MAHDMIMSGAALQLGLVLRLGQEAWGSHLLETAWFMCLAGGIGAVVGLSRGVWRYASLADIEAIVKTATGTVLLFTLSLFLAIRLDAIPRASIIASWAFMILMLAGSRVAYRLMRNRREAAIADMPRVRNVLLLGATENAEGFLKAVSERRDLPYRVLGLIDDKDRRTGLSIRGVKVLGNVDSIDDVVVRLMEAGLDVDCLIVTRTRVQISDKVFEQIAEAAQRHRIELLRLPRPVDTVVGISSDTFVPQPIALEDLLPRRTVRLSREAVGGLIDGATVLVTGAGGSIGSELCRQLAGFKPKRMVLVDASEYLLYAIDKEVRRLVGKPGPGPEIVSLLGNVRNRRALSSIFDEQRPNIVFHAAALKHVPIIEDQPLEGLLTNVVGTRNVADAAEAVNASALVLISTDKAVNPSSVMGATKRMAEIYCQGRDLAGTTRFVTVRFGNVLGSAGSVVPLFEQQIAAGGPVTVTHPEIERYFMTIPEAVELLLHAASHGLAAKEVRGRVLVLDMGQPVRILDVARKMIRLAGYKSDQEIAIEFIGLRPGEKLHEELFGRGDEPVATTVPGVLSAAPRIILDQVAVAAMLDELAASIEAADLASALAILRRMVPEYTGNERLSRRTDEGTSIDILR